MILCRALCTPMVTLPQVLRLKWSMTHARPLPPGCEGEEASRGPNVFMGYFDEPELTARALDEEGWYYSGDLCRMDEAGYIKITGRKKDIIVRGGENISSREVEDILLQHPKIHDACVVAMPDERFR